MGRLYDDEEGEWREIIVQDHQTPVPDQPAFRCDFPAWLAAHSPRNRRVAEALAVGHTGSEVARRFELSPCRVSQLRGELARSWREFHGEEVEAEVS